MTLKKLLNKIFGYRWSLYIVKNQKELVYAMHENSVIRIVGYVMGYYKNGSEPVTPWSLHLNFNKSHTSFKLKSSHFTADGKNITPELVDKIESIDPDFKVKGGEPVFVDVLNDKKLDIRHQIENIPIEERIKNFDKYKREKPTFFSVMNKVFGR